MRIDVLLGEAAVTSADVAARIVIVIDVMRAASTVATALANGARGVYPFETVEEAARRAAEMDRDTVRLAGERRMVRVPGFDFGNSPLEFTAEAVNRRTILLTTTNGTPALVATHGARACFFAGFVNAAATVEAARQLIATPDTRLGPPDVTIVCAGQDRRVALEDVVCAGRLLRGIRGHDPEIALGDGAFIAEAIERPYRDGILALATDATHARALTAAGFGDDVTRCLELDAVPVPVVYRTNRLEPFTAPTAPAAGAAAASLSSAAAPATTPVLPPPEPSARKSSNKSNKR